MTATFPDISISTERLVLRPYEEDDIPALVEMMNDELMTAWTGVPHPYTADDAREFVTRTAPAQRDAGPRHRARRHRVPHPAAGRHRQPGRAPTGASAAPRPATSPPPGPAARATPASPCSPCAAGSSASRASSASNCAPPPTTPPPSRSPRRSAASARACCAARAWSAPGPRATRPARGARSRTDLLVWSLLPEDLDDLADHGAGLGGGADEAGYDPAYPSYADWR